MVFQSERSKSNKPAKPEALMKNCAEDNWKSGLHVKWGMEDRRTVLVTVKIFGTGKSRGKNQGIVCHFPFERRDRQIGLGFLLFEIWKFILFLFFFF